MPPFRMYGQDGLQLILSSQGKGVSTAIPRTDRHLKSLRRLAILWFIIKLRSYVAGLNRLSFAYSVVKNHFLGSNPIQGITGIKRSVCNYMMLFQFAMVGQDVFVLHSHTIYTVYPALVIRCCLAIVCSYLPVKLSPAKEC